jgi:hypothetical protein
VVTIAKRKNVLLLYGYHPDESYAINVVKEVEKLALPDVVVKEFRIGELPARKYKPNSWPILTWPRRFGDLMKDNNAKWAIDVHSETDDYIETDDEFLNSRLLGTIGWGYREDYKTTFYEFFKKHYNGVDVLSLGVQSPWCNMRKGSFTLGLLTYRPLEKSVDLVKNFSEYLKGKEP